MLVASLPPELVDHILSYLGYVNRHGMYMRRLAKDDARFTLYASVPRPRVCVHGKSVFVYIDFFRETERGWVSRNFCMDVDLRTSLFTYGYHALLNEETPAYYVMYR